MPHYPKLFRRLLPFALLLPGFTGHAQPFVNIQINGSVNANEPSVAIDPRNPAHVVAGANISSYFISSDTGHTWYMGRLRSAYGVWGDPVITVDTLGSFYFFHLSDMSTRHRFGDPGWIDRMVCQRMDQFSGVWDSGSYAGLNAPKAQDKPGVVYDAVTNKLYLAWTQFDEYGSSRASDSSFILFSSSSDRGQTWSPAVRVSTKGGDCVDKDRTVEGAVPAVGPDATVYISWASEDGIVFKKSIDGGQTWPSQETLVSTLPGGWDYYVSGLQRCSGLPYTACDLSKGPYGGNIYVNWSDIRNGADNPDVWLARSTDGGTTWSSPIRVNDDTTRSGQFMSTMTIDQATGYIYVLFYDRRNSQGSDSTDVYMAVSKDGGAHFDNMKVSATPFVPDRSVFLGDYIAISAVIGIVRPVWTRADLYQTSIWTALVDLRDAPNAVAPVTLKTSLHLLYPNPFSAELIVPFSLEAPAAVSLSVTDIYGCEVASMLTNKPLPAGNYSERFSATAYGLAPGLYFFVLHTSDNERIVQKALFQP